MKNYESSVRPLKNISEKLTVKISIRLQQIGGLNERNQVLTTILFLEQIWEDDYLKWNESEFGNVRTLRIPAKQVWTPDTYVFNKNALDISSYWDSTDWMLKQSSLSYTYRSTDQLTVWKPTTKSTGILNIESHDNKLNIKKQTDLVLKLFLQRRSFFYIWNIVIPCILLTLLTLVTFWTPIDSGEKITLGLSVFLAFSMFMMLIAERVPPTSKNIPLIGVYMTSVMTLTTGSVVVCVIVINLDSRGEKLTRVEKLSISNSNQEKKLFEIGYQISILSKLNQLLRKEQNLTEEIQSIYQKYCHLLHFMKKSPLHKIPTNSIYHHDVLIEKDENHLNSQHHLSSSMKSSTLLKVKLPTTSNYKSNNQHDHLIEQNCLLNNYLPSSLLHDSIELLNNNSHTSISNVHNNVNFTNMHQLNSKNNEKVKHELIKYEWKVLAKITDRLLFITFVLITLICYITIFVWPFIVDTNIIYGKNY
ncbi:Neuronal acetylcholine receptor subunit alpha-9-I [Schistosoma japonicum]|nr:Neuronal acetylcholine receptor subunit alpha-9-I [Schistosoma japonicum]